jgi:hypothetical protein
MTLAPTLQQRTPAASKPGRQVGWMSRQCRRHTLELELFYDCQALRCTAAQQHDTACNLNQSPLWRAANAIHALFWNVFSFLYFQPLGTAGTGWYEHELLVVGAAELLHALTEPGGALGAAGQAGGQFDVLGAVAELVSTVKALLSAEAPVGLGCGTNAVHCHTG